MLGKPVVAIGSLMVCWGTMLNRYEEAKKIREEKVLIETFPLY